MTELEVSNLKIGETIFILKNGKMIFGKFLKYDIEDENKYSPSNTKGNKVVWA